MAIVSFRQPIYIRTDPRTKRAIESVLFKLKGCRDLDWLGKVVTQEAIVNASWLYLDALPEGELVTIFREYLSKLEAIMREGASARDSPPTPSSQPLPTPPRSGGPEPSSVRSARRPKKRPDSGPC